MLKIGIVGCGLQAATIAGYTGVYGDDYEVTAVKVYDFLQTMKTGQRARTDLITGNGIYGTLSCLCARESADKREFIKVTL